MSQHKVAEKTDEIELDLETNLLQGWEPYYCPYYVEVLRIAKRLGHDIPAVDVTLTSRGIYQLVYGTNLDGNYGGHSRSVLALQDSELLCCNVFDEHRVYPASQVTEWRVVFRDIREMRPRYHYGGAPRLLENLERLPRDIKRKFMKEHDFVMFNGGLIKGEHLRNPPPF